MSPSDSQSHCFAMAYGPFGKTWPNKLHKRIALQFPDSEVLSPLVVPRRTLSRGRYPEEL